MDRELYNQSKLLDIYQRSMKLQSAALAVTGSYDDPKLNTLPDPRRFFDVVPFLTDEEARPAIESVPLTNEAANQLIGDINVLMHFAQAELGKKYELLEQKVLASMFSGKVDPYLEEKGIKLALNDPLRVLARKAISALSPQDYTNHVKWEFEGNHLAQVERVLASYFAEEQIVLNGISEFVKSLSDNRRVLNVLQLYTYNQMYVPFLLLSLGFPEADVTRIQNGSPEAGLTSELTTSIH